MPAAAPDGVGLDSHAVRTRMVRKLAAQGVSDARVLAAMGLVERHRFVDTALVNQAYEDTDRKSTRLNSSHIQKSRMPSSA